MRKKLINKLLPSLITTAFICFSLAFSTLAFGWFSENKVVDATGMKMSAQADSNLVIATSVEEIKLNLEQRTSPFSVTFTTEAKKVAPCTHKQTVEGSASYDSGLAYVTNPSEIDYDTGMKKTSGSALIFARVQTSATSRYYVDFVVYIASADVALSNQDLTVTISNDGTTPTRTQLAASIDFYVGDAVNQSTYKGTLNLAGKNPETQASQTSIKILTSGNIGINTTGGIKITMRCYFDGNLQENASKAYVNSKTVNTSNVNLKVIFTATNSAA